MKKKIITAILLMALFAPFDVHALDHSPFQLSLFDPIQLFPDDSDVRGLRLNLLYGKNRNVYGLDTGSVNLSSNDAKGIQVGWLANAVGKHVGPMHDMNFDGDMKGVQIAGLGNTVGDMKGVQASGFLDNAENMRGVQVGGGMNFSHCTMEGVQVGGFGSLARYMKGIQLSIVLNGVKDMKGIQLGLGNDATSMKGIQFGGCGNMTWKCMRGVQIGGFGNQALGDLKGIQTALVINYGHRIRGTQIGLLNYCSEMYGVQIGLVNIIKEGPLPFFPLINASFIFPSSRPTEDREDKSSLSW